MRLSSRNAIGIVTAAVILAMSLGEPAGSQDPEPDVVRVEHVYREDPVVQVTCEIDICSTRFPGAVATVFPSSMGRVDITATLTIEYETSADAAPGVRMSIDPPGERPRRMAPGLLSLAASGGTTTSMTWVSRGHSSDSGQHTFN